MSDLDQRAPRCSLANVHTAEVMEARFNPTQLQETIRVNYARLGVQGLSHQVLQYDATGNRELPAVEFYVDRFVRRPPGGDGDQDVLAFRDFLRALTVPPADQAQVAGAAPPRVLFVWPRVLTVEAVLTSVTFAYTRFGWDGSVLAYTATATFEEILDVRVTSEQRRTGG